MFVDRVTVTAKAGDGGRGCVSFRREKFVPRGGPDGGDGGKGGDIVLRVDPHTDNLAGLFYEPLIKGKNGEHGQGKKMHGRGAPAKIVKVPPGTVVWRMPDRERQKQNEEERDESFKILPRNPSSSPGTMPVRDESMVGKLPNEKILQAEKNHAGENSTFANLQFGMDQPLADLVQPNDEFLLCAGGKGGKGNVHFKSSRNRAPRQYTEGEAGEEGTFLLELRTIADVGLVGYPNAGKSTLLRCLSSAHPKVAEYPFTTLHPMIGVVDFSDYKRATIADIPGLIEGAHRNFGLGHAFLRHITRCRLLLFVLDVAGSEGRNPIDDLQHLRREVDLYDPRLSQRSWRIVANKIDLPGAEENLATLRARFPAREVLAVSAKNCNKIEEVKRNLEQWLEVETSSDDVQQDFPAQSVVPRPRE